MARQATQVMGGKTTVFYLFKHHIDHLSRIDIEEFFPACYTSAQTLQGACAETFTKGLDGII
jgi:hypothetical protein